MKRSRLWLVLPGLLAVLLLAGCTHNQKVTSKRGGLPAIEKPKYRVTGAGTYATHHRDGRAYYPEEHRKSHRHLGMERVRMGQQTPTANATVRTQQVSSPSRPITQTTSLWQRCVRTLNHTFKKPAQNHKHYAEEAVPQRQRDMHALTHRHHETFRKIPVRGTFNNIHEHRLDSERQQPSVMQEKHTPRKPVPVEVIF